MKEFMEMLYCDGENCDIYGWIGGIDVDGFIRSVRATAGTDLKVTIDLYGDDDDIMVISATKLYEFVESGEVEIFW